MRLEITARTCSPPASPEGPAVGRGLDAALRAKLDGETSGARGRAADRPRRGGLLALRPMEWRERDGVRWLEAELPGARAAFSTRHRRSEQRAVRVAQPRPLHRRRPRARCAATGPVWRRALGATPTACCSASRSTAPRSTAASEPPEPEPVQRAGRPAGRARRPGDLEPRPDPAGAGRRLPAGGARRRARRGDAPLRLARAGGGDRRPAGPRRSARPPRRSVPGSGPAATRSAPRCWRRSRGSATGSPPGACSTCPRSRGACSTAAGVDAVESSGLCTSCEPELFFSHRRDAGRTGRQAGLVVDRCLSRSATSTRRSCAATSSGCASAAGPTSRSWPRPSTSSPEEMRAPGRGGGRAGRREPPSGPRGQARARRRPRSPGTSSATSRAARSSGSCRWCG